MFNDYGKSLFKPWLSVQNSALGLAMAFLLALAIRSYKLNSGEIAAWVQAVGSIAAIFTAVVIAHRDSALRRKAVLDARSGALARASAVAGDAVDRVKAAFEAVNSFGVNASLLSSVTPHLEQCMRYLTDALNVQGLDSDIYAELFMARKSVEEATLLLPGIRLMDTANSEAEMLEALKRAHKNLLAMQKTPY